MELKKEKFRFNGFEEETPLTMEEAIERARKSVLDNQSPVRLYVKSGPDKWLELATYSPIKVSAWEKYHEDPDDDKSPLIPQVDVDLHHVTDFKADVKRIVAVLHKGTTKGLNFYTLLFNGRRDPLNRTFQGGLQEGHRTAIQDLENWFETVKKAGFYPNVKELTFPTI